MTSWRSIDETGEDRVVLLRGLPATTPASYERFYRRRGGVTLGLVAFLFHRLISWSVALTAHVLVAALLVGIYLEVTKEDEALLFASLWRGNAGEEGKKLDDAPAFEPPKEEVKEPEPPKPRPEPEPPKTQPVPEPPKPVEKAPEKEVSAPAPVPDAAPKPVAVGAGASATGRPAAAVSDAEVEKNPTAALRARRAGEIDQLRKGSEKDIVVVRGQYDTVEVVLGRLGIPHRVVDAEKLPGLDLSDCKILLLNCHNLYGAYLFKEADTAGLEKLISQLESKEQDLERRIAGTKDPRALYRLRLDLNQTSSYRVECRRRLEGLSYSGKVADAVGAFVRKGGYVFTSDWGLSILERGLPGYVRNGGNVGPKTVGIRPRAGKEQHELLEGVFYENAKGGTVAYRKFLWEIDSSSYLIKVEKPGSVETLVESAEVPKCPAVAVVITPEAPAGGARPGRVLHILSHFQKQATQQGDYALQSMLLNFMLDRVRPPDRRAAALPEAAAAPAAAAPAPKAEFSGVHRDEKGRFTLHVPKGWTMAATGDPANPVVLEKAGEGVKASLSVAAAPLRVDRSFDWDPYVRELSAEMERQADGFKVRRKMQAFTAGHPALYLSTTFQKGALAFGMLHYTVVTPQGVYALSWTAPGDAYPEWEPVFEQASRAFTVPPRAP